MRILVTGGAGYIGSHTVRQLVDAGHDVWVLDNFYSGHAWAVAHEATLVEGDIADKPLVNNILTQNNIEAVVHFAGHIVVPESVSVPFKYYQNNVVGSLTLIECCLHSDVNHFVFSSSAAVYGMPARSPVDEHMPTSPINPYGNTKLITEFTLQDAAASLTNRNNFNFIALRYFNAAGASFSGKLGQATPEATHLIKVACEAACGARAGMSIFGEDYPTPDGSCVRDYIHVEDLAQAHLDAINYLGNGGDSHSLNCGYGLGYSVKQVVDTVKKVSGVDFAVKLEGRRAGDPPELIADNSKIRSVLGWVPQHDNLEGICQTAFEWEKIWQQRKNN